MLKIIMGSERVKEFTDRKLIQFPNYYFNEMKKQEWFKDEFVKEIIRTIDKAEVELGYSVHSIEYDAGYSVNDLAGGTKTLILIHKLRDLLFLAVMGDNCTDFLERIVADYEKEGKDLLIVENYLHRFQFRYIDSIYYVNWGITCHSLEDIDDKIKYKWYEQDQSLDWDREDTPEEMEEMLNVTEEMIRKAGVNIDDNN